MKKPVFVTDLNNIIYIQYFADVDVRRWDDRNTQVTLEIRECVTTVWIHCWALYFPYLVIYVLGQAQHTFVDAKLHMLQICYIYLLCHKLAFDKWIYKQSYFEIKQSGRNVFNHIISYHLH